MKNADVDLVFSCMEGTDNLAFSESHAPVRHDYALRLAERLQPVGDQGQPDRHERSHLR